MVLMRKILLIFTLLVLIPSFVIAQIIDVNIKGVLSEEVRAVSYDSSIESKPFKIGFELFNTGSIGYTARARLDVFDNDTLVYTGWSDEKTFLPGYHERFYLYWYPSDVGNYTGQVMVYYANEVKELDPVRFEVKSRIVPKKTIEIIDFKTYDEEVELKIKSNQSLENVIIIPSEYPPGWIFEQRMIKNLEKNEIKKVGIPYKPSLWKESNVRIEIVTENGEYYMTGSFLLERETGLRRFLHYSLKWLEKHFSGLFK